jgi:hypothetical protein
MSTNARRGKVLSPPQPSAPEPAVNPSIPPSKPPASPSRGKVLGKVLTSTSNQATPASSSVHGTDIKKDSLSNLKNFIRKAKAAASTHCKEVASQRDRVFDDLNHVENIILSLLECASDVADSLSEMTSAKINEKGNNEDANSFEELSARVRENGVGYLAGMKKLHRLLAPHAPLVKSYQNPEEGDAATSGDTAATETT